MSATNVGNIEVRFSGRTEGLDNALNRINKGFSGLQTRIDSSLKRVERFKKTTNKLAMRLGVIAAALGLAVRQGTEYASTMKAIAEQTGLAMETVQGLGYAVSQTNSDISTLSTGLRALVRRAAEAHAGNAQFANYFKRMGVEVRDVNGHIKDTEQLLLDVADATARMGTEAEASAALMNVMGDAGRQLVPFMRQGANGINELMQEARRLGLVMDERVIRKLADFSDQTSRTTQRIGAAGREIAVQFLPVLNRLDGLINDVITGFMGLDDQTKANIAILGTMTAGALGLVIGLGILASGVMLVLKTFGLFGALGSFLFSPLFLGLAALALTISGLANLLEHSNIKERISTWWTEVYNVWTDQESTLKDKLAGTAWLTVDLILGEGTAASVKSYWANVEETWGDEELSFTEKVSAIKDLTINLLLSPETQEKITEIWNDVKAKWSEGIETFNAWRASEESGIFGDIADLGVAVLEISVEAIGDLYDAVKTGLDTGDWGPFWSVASETWSKGVLLAVGFSGAAKAVIGLRGLILSGLGLVTATGLPGALGLITIGIQLMEAKATGDFESFGWNMFLAVAAGIGAGILGGPGAGVLVFTVALNFKLFDTIVDWFTPAPEEMADLSKVYPESMNLADDPVSELFAERTERVKEFNEEMQKSSVFNTMKDGEPWELVPLPEKSPTILDRVKSWFGFDDKPTPNPEMPMPDAHDYYLNLQNNWEDVLRGSIPSFEEPLVNVQEEFGSMVKGIENLGDSLGELGQIIPITTQEIDEMVRMVHAEAEGESSEGKVGVAATIINRVVSELFPDSVHDVLHAVTASGAYEFSPLGDGRFHQDISEAAYQVAYEAVMLALAGVDPTGGALFFHNPVTAPNAWARTHRPYATSIGNHDFHHSEGVILPGYGGGDRRPAILEDGEAVVPKEAVRGGSDGVLSWFRSMGAPGFSGGYVPGNLPNISGLSTGTSNDLTSVAAFVDQAASGIDSLVETIFGGLETAISKIETAILTVARVLTKDDEAFSDLEETILGYTASAREGIEGFRAMWASVTDELEDSLDDTNKGLEVIVPSLDEFLKNLADSVKIESLLARQTGQAFDPLQYRIQEFQNAIDVNTRSLLDQKVPIEEAIGYMTQWSDELKILIEEQEELNRVLERQNMIRDAVTQALSTLATRLDEVSPGLGAFVRNLNFDDPTKVFDIHGLVMDSVSFLVNTVADLFDTGRSELKQRIANAPDPGQDILSIADGLRRFQDIDKNMQERQQALRDLYGQQRSIATATAGGAAAGAGIGFLIGGPIGALIGGLFGGSAANKVASDTFGPRIQATEEQIRQLEAQIENARTDLIEALGIGADHFASSIASAFQAADINEFSERLGQSVRDQIRQAMVQAFIAQALEPQIMAMSEMIQAAFLEGATLDMELLDSQIADIVDQSSRLYDMFEELGLTSEKLNESFRDMHQNVPRTFKYNLYAHDIESAIPGLASGGYVPARPGGTIVRLAEAGEGEWVIPESRLGGGNEQEQSKGGVYVDMRESTFIGERDLKRRFAAVISEVARENNLSDPVVVGT